MTNLPTDDADENERCPACGAALGTGQPSPSVCPRCGHRAWFFRVNPAEDLIIKLECTGSRPAHLDEIIDQFPKGVRILGLVLDFREVKGVYSADLAKLITLKRKVLVGPRGLKIRNLHPDLREIFRITRLDEVFEIEE